MKKILSISVITVALFSCSLQDEDTPKDAIPAADAPSVKTEAITGLSDYGIEAPFGLLKFGGDVLVGDYMSSYNIYRIDLSARQGEGLQPRVRTRSGGAVMLNTLASDGKGGWLAFDAESGCINNMPSLMTRAGGETETALPEGQRHLWATKVGDYMVSTGIYTEGRYLLYSPADGQAHYFVNYPEHPSWPDIEERTKSVLFASNVLRARPDGNAFVCADMYSGVMDICRIEGKEVVLVQRLVYHYPKVRIREQEEWPRVVYSQENRFGFTDVCATDHGIYALYSGRTYKADKKTFQHCRTMLEIGWDGVVKHTYPVDIDLTHITYDEKEKALFGIAYKPEMTLVRLNMPYGC